MGVAVLMVVPRVLIRLVLMHCDLHRFVIALLVLLAGCDLYAMQIEGIHTPSEDTLSVHGSIGTATVDDSTRDSTQSENKTFEQSMESLVVKLLVVAVVGMVGAYITWLLTK